MLLRFLTLELIAAGQKKRLFSNYPNFALCVQQLLTLYLGDTYRSQVFLQKGFFGHLSLHGSDLRQSNTV